MTGPKTSGPPVRRADGRCRTVISAVQPQVDGGEFPIKRSLGESVTVEADVFTDGHDAARCRLLHRHASKTGWTEIEMEPLGNDRWRASFTVEELGRHLYTVTGWTDRLLTWQRELERRSEPADVLIALRIGVQLLEDAATRAKGSDATILMEAARKLAAAKEPESGRQLALDPALAALFGKYPDRRFETAYDRVLEVVVDPPLARFGAWYELFPRSTSPEPGRHGTFVDCEAQLPGIADMGFDVLYIPPVHPIGRTRRKGPNNSLSAGPDDPGTPWAIGSTDGGHLAVHPELGTLEEFRHFVERARALGLEVALDIAFQCSPDHPYVKEHPEWFRFRPDGSVQYAENPPKKYQDIYPFDFESEAWEPLHAELRDVVLHWVAQGVRIFRIDNPHTKPFPFWARLIAEVKQRHPEIIFLAEAFTRPKVMRHLAKLGFSQSYTYFTWRNTKWELEQYFTELALGPTREYFRPNVWPNTPDILTEYLQYGGRAAFLTRAVLAATLSASYGIYGPAFELLEREPREPGSEEYLNSEKYQLRQWDPRRPESLRPFLTRLNQVRRENPALHSDWSLKFISVDNDQLIAFAKATPDRSNVVLVVANLDPHNPHTGWLDMPLAELGLDANRAYRMHDLLGGGSYLWRGPRNFVRLDPTGIVAHVLRVQRHVRTERDFDYFM